MKFPQIEAHAAVESVKWVSIMRPIRVKELAFRRRRFAQRTIGSMRACSSGDIAQSAEQLPFKERVEGSSPSVLTKK